MAGDWIKMEINLHEKPEVIKIAGELGLDRYSVVGRLHRLWSWFNAHTVDGHAHGVTDVTVDELVSHQGFAAALRQVGWLLDGDDGVLVPAFDKHNGESAKKRAQSADRQRRSRANRDTGHANSVTEARPEKRREEKSSKKGKFVPPTLEEVQAYVQERGSSVDPRTFCEYFDAAQWHDSRGNPVKSWKQKLIMWEKQGYGQPKQAARESDDLMVVY